MDLLPLNYPGRVEYLDSLKESLWFISDVDFAEVLAIGVSAAGFDPGLLCKPQKNPELAWNDNQQGEDWTTIHT